MAGKVVVTGGAGFIPSHVEDILVSKGYDVTAVDVIDRKDCHNISHLFDRPNFSYVRADASDVDSMVKATEGCDFVYHMAANSDIRNGGKDPSIDFNKTFLTTRATLEAMRVNGIKKLFFSSTSAVYGDRKGLLDENTGGLQPISYYGSCKMASESLISSYAYMNDFDALIFRFPNVIGPRLTHGVIFDFIGKLKRDPTKLQILGDGKQNKQYVYVLDLVRGICDFADRIEKGVNVYNVSTESFTDVNAIADLVCERMGLEPEYQYTGGSTGWKGDVSSFAYNVEKAKARGWKYEFDSTGSVRETLRTLDIDSIPLY
ncbi:NAD-dependent epimerase/dehydratase [methanogenic archaeon mixed culture ISO4-G1]|nr:NAD-dependent epimerase/dehydratase [methanogenic archaeon mixed culture ISO4-G1]